MRGAGHDPGGLDRRVTDRVAEGERAAGDLLGSPDAPTALVCASDSLALGALRATTDRLVGSPAGRPGTPPRIAVIGFDDTPVAQAIGLTSVGQPLAEAAGRCVQLLARLLDRSPVPGSPEHILLRPHLVARDSG
jgi:DNA-binding LacI/PurR family transcriptional regulator